MDNDGASAMEELRSTVSVTSNALPTTIVPSVTTPEDIPINITLKSTDSDLYDRYSLKYEISSGPSNGDLAISGNVFNASGFDGSALTVVYTPSSYFFGTDQFTYTATDNLGAKVCLFLLFLLCFV